MAEIAPLTPLRYDTDKIPGGLASVVAPPYDVINAEQRAELAAKDPHNVVRLILPEGEGDSKYAHAAELLADIRAKNVLVRDDEPAFYRYDQTFTPPGDAGARPITRRGFLALVKLVPFADRIVLPHERTLSGPKEDRLKLFRATQTNLSPGFMLYQDPSNELRSPLEVARVIGEFSTPDGIKHVLAKVSDADAMRAITAKIAASSLLIADGHHRYETALRYAGEVDAPSPRSASKYFMTFLVNGDDPELVVFPTHRHVHSLPSFSYEDLVSRAKATFDVTPLAKSADAASITKALREAGARGPAIAVATAAGDVTILALRKDVDLAKHPTLGPTPAALRGTDVAILHMGILEHLLGITPEAQAAKTNLYYPQDAAGALGELRGGKGQALFLMNATPVEQVRKVAEAGEVMPQKSTFFYPKVMTGLAIHTLEKDRLVAAT
jgi:uncharacterized protein (DUF1015 family)